MKWLRRLARKRDGLIDGSGDWWERIGPDDYEFLGRNACGLIRSREHIEKLYPPVMEAQR